MTALAIPTFYHKLKKKNKVLSRFNLANEAKKIQEAWKNKEGSVVE